MNRQDMSNLQTNRRKCNVRDKVNHDSDHYPMETVIILEALQEPSSPRRQWKEADQSRFQNILTELISTPQPTYTLEQTMKAMDQVNKALNQGIEESVPLLRMSKWSVPGFSEEGKEAIQLARRLRRIRQRTRGLEDFEAFRLARNQKARILNRAMRDTHRQRVEQAAGDPKGLWKLAKWAKNRPPIETVTPAIRNKDGYLKHEPRDKVKLLKQSFFPKPPEPDLSDMIGYNYPEPLETPPITELEVSRLKSPTRIFPLNRP